MSKLIKTKKDIELLVEKHHIEILEERLNEKDKEIERLNNIIDELERHLEQQYLEWKDDYNDEIVAMANEDKAILDKLKELKEGK